MPFPIKGGLALGLERLTAKFLGIENVKETTLDGDGVPKGNCDADLVLRAARDVFETKYDAAVLVSSDGDDACLVSFLQEKSKMRVILSPRNKCSILLKRTNAPITYLEDVRSRICKGSGHEKAPDADGTA